MSGCKYCGSPDHIWCRAGIEKVRAGGKPLDDIPHDVWMALVTSGADLPTKIAEWQGEAQPVAA